MQLSWAEARALGIKLPSLPSKKRVKKPTPPDSYIPHDCVILAIDPGATSGYALVSLPGLRVPSRVWSGRTVNGHKSIVKMARDASKNDVMRPLIVVAETWTTGDRVHDRRMRAATLLGLGAAWERWCAAFDAVGVPKSRIVRVNTSTWRAKIIGGPMNRTTEQWKELAALHAQQRFPVRATSGAPTEDEAEALCIAAWAMHAGPVGEAVKKAGKRYP
jgi:hypothetical protein